MQAPTVRACCISALNLIALDVAPGLQVPVGVQLHRAVDWLLEVSKAT